MKHYAVFAAHAHPTVWLIHAETLTAALVAYIEDSWGPNLSYHEGKWGVPDGWGGQSVYGHPLECLEDTEKYDCTWNITELTKNHGNAPVAEAMAADNPWEIAEYVKVASEARPHPQPGRKPRTFVWYLRDGPLVTFYERNRKKKGHRIKIIARVLIPWATWPQVMEWTGTYDDIVEQLSVGPHGMPQVP